MMQYTTSQEYSMPSIPTSICDYYYHHRVVIDVFR